MASASLRALPFILATDPNTKEGIIKSLWVLRALSFYCYLFQSIAIPYIRFLIPVPVVTYKWEAPQNQPKDENINYLLSNSDFHFWGMILHSFIMKYDLWASSQCYQQCTESKTDIKHYQNLGHTSKI